MNPDNHNEPSSPDAPGTSAADGGAAVDSSTLSLAELNQYLGKSFADKESALKSLKDTQSFVGKRSEDIERDVRASLGASPPASAPDLAKEVSQLKERAFYAEHPEYKGYEALIRKMGGDPSEVVEMTEFKDVFAKGKVADEVSQTRSVVASSPRVGQPTQATEEAIRVANATGSAEATADILARAIRTEITGEQ